MTAFPKDIKLLISPPAGQKETAGWYTEKKMALESEFNGALKKLKAQQQRQVKASESQARFLFGMAILVFVVILFIGKQVILISLFTVLPLTGLGFVYQVYSSMIGQASLQKMTQLANQRNTLINEIQPTEKDIENAFRKFEKQHQLTGESFRMFDGNLLNICNLGITCVANQLTKLRTIKMEWLKEVKSEQYMLSAILLHNEKHIFWGVDKAAIQEMTETEQSRVVSTVSVVLLNDSCTYWLILNDEITAKKVYDLVENLIKTAPSTESEEN